MTISPDEHASPPTMSTPRRERDSTRPPGSSEQRSVRRPSTRRRTTPNGKPTSARRTSPPQSRNRKRPALPAGVDAVCDGLTVSYEIRYVDGAEGDRLAAVQTDAVAALLKWIAQTNHTNSPGGQVHANDASEEGRAA